MDMTRLLRNGGGSGLLWSALQTQQPVELPGELCAVVVEVQLDDTGLELYGLGAARPSPLPPEVAPEN